MRFFLAVPLLFAFIIGMISPPLVLQTEHYTDVFFYNNTNGWVISNTGRILRTVDAANSFTAHSSGTVNGLNSIFFSSPAIGFAVGTNGTILRSTNAGNTWHVPAGVPVGLGTNELHAVFARGSVLASTIVWIAGQNGLLYRSADGGATWGAAQDTGTTTIRIRSIYFTSDTTGVFVADTGGPIATIRRSTDQGTTNTWANAVGAPTTQNVNSVKYFDTNNGIAVGNTGTIVRTTNNGANWTAATIIPTSAHLKDLAHVDSLNVWAVGAGGVVIKSPDAGITWISQTSGVVQDLNAVATIDSTNTFAVGNSLTAIKTTGPGSWENIFAPTVRANIRSISVPSATQSLLVGNRGFAAKQVDTDLKRFEPFNTATSDYLNGVFAFSDPTTYGYAVGDTGRFFEFNSTSGAVSKSSGVSVHLRGIWAAGPGASDRIIICGDKSGTEIIRFSIDRGVSWTPSTVPGTGSENLYSVSFSGATGWAVGDNGRILKSTDSAGIFAAQTGSVAHYKSVYAHDATTAIAVGPSTSGTSSVVSVTTDGTSWSSITVASSQLRAAVIIWRSGASYLGYAVGDSGKIYRITSGPLTATAVTSPTGANLTSASKYIASDGTTHLFFAGDNHTIVKTEIASGAGTEKTWINLMPALSSGDIVDIQFRSATHGWIVLDGVVGGLLRTTNNGSTWEYPGSFPVQTFKDLSYVDTSTGYAWGESAVSKSTDGGSTYGSSSRVSYFAWKKIHALTATNVLLAGEANTIIKTTNSGTNWKFVNTRNDIRGVHTISATEAIATGANGMMMRTTDSGTTWFPINSPGSTSGSFNFNKVFFRTATEGYVVRDNGSIYRTTNIGTGWTEVKTADVNCMDIHFKPSTTTGVAVGAFLDTSGIPVQKGAIWRSADGITWTKVYDTANTDQFNSVYFFANSVNASSVVVAVGNNGVIARSTNDGFSWAEIAHGLGSPVLRGVSAIWNGTNNRAVAVGDGVAWAATGTTSSDGGNTWAAVASDAEFNPATATLYSVSMIEPSEYVVAGVNQVRRWDSVGQWSNNLISFTGTVKKIHVLTNIDGNTTNDATFAVGEFGLVNRSPDGGTTWTNGATWNPPLIGRAGGSGTDTLRSIHFADGAVNGWAVGGTSGARILKSTSSGDSWFDHYSDGGGQLNDVFGADAVNAWAVGDGGRVLKSTGVAFSTVQTSNTTVNLKSVAFTSSTVGIAVGDNSSTNAVVTVTSNGGTTWTTRSIGSFMSFKAVTIKPTTNEAYLAGTAASVVNCTDITLASPTWTWKGSGLFLTPYFPDTATGFLVGNFGTMLKSTDGGVTWLGLGNSATTTASNLRAIYFIDRNTGWICGDNGLILKTTNSGSTWSAQTSNTIYNLKHMYFYDCNNGMAVGDFLARCRTTDGGTTWAADSDHNPITDPPQGYTYTSVTFLTAAAGFASATGYMGTTDGIGVYKTTDGGSTWFQAHGGGDPIVGDEIFGIHFVRRTATTTIGLAVGRDATTLVGRVFRTTNDGVNWTDISPASANRLCDVKLIVTGSTTVAAYVVGQTTTGTPCTFKSADVVTAVPTWTAYTLSPVGTVDTGNINRIRLLSSNTVIINPGSGNGFGIYSSYAGLGGFEVLAAGSTNGLHSHFIDANNVLTATGDGRIFSTNNFMKTMQLLSSGSDLNNIWAIDASNSVAVGNRGQVARLASGTWSYVPTGILDDITDVQSIAANTYVAVGANGVVLKTTDNGATWAFKSSCTQEKLNSVSFNDASNGFAVGNNGTIMRTTDGGESWARETSNTIRDLFDVHFVTATFAYAVGDGGRAVSWGGASWSAEANPGTVTENLTSVRFSDASNGFIVGSGGRYLNTTNGGSTWSASFVSNSNLSHAAYVGTTRFICGIDNFIVKSTDSGTSWQVGSVGTINSMQMVDATTGFAVCNSGRVMKTTDSGTTWTLQQSGLGQNLVGVSFNGTSTGLLVSFDFFLSRTATGGSTWTTEVPGLHFFTSVHYLDASNQYATSVSDSFIWSWTGGFWGSLFAVTGNPRSIRMANSSSGGNGWAVGDNGAVIQITNGAQGAGTTTVGTSNYKSVWYVNPEFVACGSGGAIIKTSGASWSTIVASSIANKDLFATFFVDASTGYVVGGDGIYRKSTNAGSAWDTPVQSPTNVDLRSGSFIGGNIIFLGGEEGVLLKSQTSSWTAATLFNDTALPNASIVIEATDPAGSTDYTKLTTVTLRLTASDPDSGIDRVYYSNDGVFDTEPSETFSSTKTGWAVDQPTVEGLKTVYYRVYDMVGNFRTVQATTILDLNNPDGSIQINNNTATTIALGVTLQLSATDLAGSGIKGVRYANEADPFAGPLETFALTKAWTLAAGGTGLRTVRYEITDNVNNVVTRTDTINYDPSGGTPPVASISITASDPAGSSLFTRLTSVTLSLTASHESGILQVWYSNDGVFDTEPAEAFSSTKAWTLAAGDGTKTVYYQVQSNFGNFANSQASILLDQTPPNTFPSSSSILINGGAAYTNTTSVTLNLSASDLSGIKGVRYANDTPTFGGGLLPFSSTQPWTLTAGPDGVRTVYYEVTDNANNVAVVSDSITLDSAVPAGTIVILGPPNQINEGTPALLSWSYTLASNEFFEVKWGEDLNSPQGTINTTDQFYGIPSNLLILGRTYNWRVTVKDNAGNTGTFATSSFSVVTAVSGTLVIDNLPRVNIDQLNSAQNVLMMNLIATAGSIEDINISSIKIKEVGSPNAPGDVTSVQLYHDTNNNNSPNPGVDTLLVQTSYSNTITFNLSPNLFIPRGTSKGLLIVYNFSGGAFSGHKFQVQIESAASITATGANPVTPGGTFPMTGRLVTIVPNGSLGRVVFDKGAKSPTDGDVLGLQQDVNIMQFRLEAAVADFILDRITVEAKGTADDNLAISNVELYLDNDASGTFTSGDSLVATNKFFTNNGFILFQNLNITVLSGSGNVKNFLIRYDLTDIGFNPGQTVQPSIRPETIIGVDNGGAQVIASGILQDGAVKTFTTPGSAKGVITITKKSSVGLQRIQPYEHNIVMLKALLQVEGIEDVIISQVLIRSIGSGNEPKDITSLLLAEDTNGDNEFSPDIDTILHKAEPPFVADNGLALMTDLSIRIPKGSNKTWFFLFNYSGFGEDDANYKAVWDIKTQLSVKGVDSTKTIDPQGDSIEGDLVIVNPLVGSSGKESPKGCISAKSIDLSRNNPMGPMALLIIMILFVVTSFSKRRTKTQES